MKSAPSCPVCETETRCISSWGKLGFHSVRTIAGINVESANQPFALFRCPNCDLVFKLPRLSGEELEEIYALSDDRIDNFEDQSPPTSQRLRLVETARLCEQVAVAFSEGRRVLEIGCSNGAMLHAWSREWQKYGVEPSVAAAQIAQKRGIHVIASTIDQVDQGEWDCIISVDTIEHVADPLQFYQSAMRLLAPGGIIITLTGNMSCSLARYAGSRYWYASFPEHIGFLSPRTLGYIANRFGGEVLHSSRYRWGCPGGFDMGEWTLQGAKYFCFACLLLISKVFASRAPFLRRSFPVMTAHADHHLTVIGGFQ